MGFNVEWFGISIIILKKTGQIQREYYSSYPMINFRLYNRYIT